MQDKDRIALILGCMEKILRYSAGKDYEDFIADSMLTDACVFNLSQIGELSHSLSNDFLTAHPDVPWQAIYGLRNRIVHHYEGVNLRVVWEVVSEDIPKLHDYLSGLATEERNDNDMTMQL